MNNLKMDDVDKELRKREIARSLAPKRQEVAGRPKLAKIDKLHERMALDNYLKGLDNYV